MTKKQTTTEVAQTTETPNPAAVANTGSPEQTQTRNIIAPRGFRPEMYEADKASAAKLLGDPTTITQAASGLTSEEWAEKFAPTGTVPSSERPRGLPVPQVAEHVNFMLENGIAHMPGLNYERADAATVAEIVLNGLDRWADELSGEPAVEHPHLYERAFTVPTGACTATGEAQTARIGVRIGKDISVTEEDATNAKIDAARARYLAYDIGCAGVSELKVISQLEADLVAVASFDARTGEPVMKLAFDSKARDVAERRLADARRSLRLVQIECALAYKLQSEHAVEVAAEEADFEEAVNSRAGQILIEDEARKRATALAARRSR